MATDEETKVPETPAVTFNEIRNNLVFTDEHENHFRFSRCRNRNIVVLGSKEITTHIVSDIIRHGTYINNYTQPRKELQNMITYIMTPDDTACNVCIVNLIDIPAVEYFIKRSEKHGKDQTQLSMAEIDQIIYQFVTNIDLIVLVCKPDNFGFMKNVKKWASNRGHIMALAVVEDPKFGPEEREKVIRSIRHNKEFIDNRLGDFFAKGIFCISDLSYNRFRNSEQILAKSFVHGWRSEFLRACVGGPNDSKYELPSYEDKQITSSFSCNLA